MSNLIRDVLNREEKAEFDILRLISDDIITTIMIPTKPNSLGLISISDNSTLLNGVTMPVVTAMDVSKDHLILELSLSRYVNKIPKYREVILKKLGLKVFDILQFIISPNGEAMAIGSSKTMKRMTLL